MTEDEMVGWHRPLNGHEFEPALGVGDGQRSLACCKESDMTERLNNPAQCTRRGWGPLPNSDRLLPSLSYPC